MRLSTSTNILCFDMGKNYAVPMAESVRVCAREGYTYLDANLCAQCRPGMPLAQDDWEAWAHGIRALGEEVGVRFTQAHAYWAVPPNHILQSDMRTPDAWGEELMRRSVVAAEILGVAWMVVHPFNVMEDGRCSMALSAEHNRAYFSRWAEVYAKHHVGMAIENMIHRSTATRYAADIEQLVELIERIDHPMVGACLDTGHAHLSGEDVAGAVRLLGKHLHATHIADNNRNADEHIAPFGGTIAWADVMRALRDIQYRDDFSFEIQRLSAPYPASVQHALVRFSFELGNYLLRLAENE